MSAGLFGKLPAKRDFVAANAAAPVSRGLGALAAGGRRDVEADAGPELDRGLQPRADLALLAGRGLLRRGDDRRFHALDRRRRPIVPARGFRRRRRSVSPAAGARTERRLVRSGGGGLCSTRSTRPRRSRPSQTRSRACRRPPCCPGPPTSPASGSCPRAGSSSATSIARFRSRFSPPGASAIAALSRRNPFGGRSAAKASRRSPCPPSGFRRRLDSSTC